MQVRKLGLLICVATWALSSLTAAGQTLPTALDRQARETIFFPFQTHILSPWFEAQADGWVDGLPSEEGAPVKLRYKAFVDPEHEANLVIVHGYGERAEKYQEFMYDAFRRGFNVFYVDQRGFGHSSRINPEGEATYVRTFEDYADDMAHFITEVVDVRAPGLRKYVYAHSMGGLVAVQLAHKHPEMIHAVVLNAPMLDIKTAPFPQTVVLGLGSVFSGLGVGGRYAFGQIPAHPEAFEKAHTSSEARWQAFQSFIRQPDEWRFSAHGASFRWIKESLRASREAIESEYASQVKVPIVLFQAENDALIDRKGQALFCERAPNCERVFVAGAKHEIYRESDAIRVPYLQQVFAFYEHHGKARNRETRIAAP